MANLIRITVKQRVILVITFSPPPQTKPMLFLLYYGRPIPTDSSHDICLVLLTGRQLAGERAREGERGEARKGKKREPCLAIQ